MLEHFFCDDWLENKMFYLFSFPARKFNWKFGLRKRKKWISLPRAPFWAEAQLAGSPSLPPLSL